MSSMRHEARLNQLDQRLDAMQKTIADLEKVIKGLKSEAKPAPQRRQKRE